MLLRWQPPDSSDFVGRRPRASAHSELTAWQTNRYQPQIDNVRRLRQIVTALEALATNAAKDTETWGPNSEPNVRNIS